MTDAQPLRDSLDLEQLALQLQMQKRNKWGLFWVFVIIVNIFGIFTYFIAYLIENPVISSISLNLVFNFVTLLICYVSSNKLQNTKVKRKRDILHQT